MQRVVVWCGLGALLFSVGCHRVGPPPAPSRTGPAASEQPAGPGAGLVGGAPAAAAGLTPNQAAPPPGAAPKPPTPKPRQYAPKEIVIAWEASLMYLLKDGKPAAKPLIVNGALRQYLRPAHIGSFKITEKSRLKRSNLYDVNGDPLPEKEMAETNGAIMRNWMRLGSLPVGLHYSPAFRFHRSASRRHRSHGCYRMSRRDSDMVFRWAPIGTPVHVVRSLGGSEWAFLIQSTPPDLLPGYKPTRTASAASSRTAAQARKPAARPAAKPAAAAAKPAAAPPPATVAAPPASGIESGTTPAPPAPPTEPDSTPAGGEERRDPAPPDEPKPAP